MLVLLSSLASPDVERDAHANDLHYEKDNGNFWMRCVMGDDWLQRVNSCRRLEFRPVLVRSSENALFVVFETDDQVRQFEDWLRYAEGLVEEGYRTMRG